VRGEVVAGEAEGADPDLGGEVDAGKGVEDGRARRFAAERGVGEDDKGGGGADRGDGGGDGDHALARLHLGSGPRVPGHADAVWAVGVRSSGGAASAYGEVLRHGRVGYGGRYDNRNGRRSIAGDVYERRGRGGSEGWIENITGRRRIGDRNYGSNVGVMR
ncbi:hypothetical protein GW17_00051610, partial [Ensete ventricosum]